MYSLSMNLDRTLFSVLSAFNNLSKITFLLFIPLSLLVIFGFSDAKTAYANGNLLQNPAFESGTLTTWVKWPGSNSGIISVVTSNHTRNGHWGAKIQPKGSAVQMQQNVSLTPGGTYYLEAFVSTSGMTATIEWWSNIDGNHQCGSTNSSQEMALSTM